MIIDSDASVIVPSTNFLYTEMIDENIIDSFVEWHYNHSQKYFNKGLGESINEKNRETGEDDLSSPLGLVNSNIKESMDTPYMNMVILPKVNDFVSAVYSLHTNDGGTEVKGKFYPSIEGQAVMFDSDVFHRGIPPKKDRHRFNLALVIRR